MKYVPVLVGKSARQVHAGYQLASGWRHVCGQVNSRMSNRHPPIRRLAADRAITCANCLRMIKESGRPQ